MANFHGLQQFLWAALSSILLAVAYFFKSIAKMLAGVAGEFNRRAGL